MAIGIRFVDKSYSISGHIATISFTFELYDDTILDDNGVPITLDTKTVTVRQNMLNPNARVIIKQELEKQIQEYLEKAKINMGNILNIFGSLDADTILSAIQSDVELDLPTILTNVFGA